MKKELGAVKKTDNHEAAFEIIEKKLQVHPLLGQKTKQRKDLFLEEKCKECFSSFWVGGHMNYMGPTSSSRTTSWACSVSETDYIITFCRPAS